MISNCNNLEDYMAQYGTILGNRTASAVAPLHKPSRDAVIEVDVLREPFEAQAHVISAAIKQLRRAKTAIMVGECGTGKTMMAMAACHGHAAGKSYRAVVMVPPHLVGKWQREIAETIPGAVIAVLKTYHDVVKLDVTEEPDGPEWYVVSQTSAKMTPKWVPQYVLRKRPVGVPYCPRCGEPITRVEGKARRIVPVPPKDLERTRMTCPAEGCGEQLWQWTSEPDRWPIAKYAQRKMRGFFDYFVIDEVHQAKGEDTAIATNMSRFVAASKKVIALTGTLLGGYAYHLRTLLYRLSPRTLLADGMTYEETSKFNQKYGRIETTTIERAAPGKDFRKSNTQSEGKQGSSRVVKAVRPGVMPSLFGKHLIDKCIFLSLNEVADNLPELTEQVIPVTMDIEQELAYRTIEARLRDAIRDMVQRGDRRLLGTMLRTLLGYCDYPYGREEIGYYDTTVDGQQKWVGIVTPENLSDLTVRPKEQALIDQVAHEVDLGRQCWVFTTMTDKHDVVARLEKLLQINGFRVKTLRSSVVTGEREEWIAQNGPEAEVIISHPALVETGLDLFDKSGTYNFTTLMSYQTGYGLFTLRQASRRSWRIGQVEQCKVLYFYYDKTMQSRAMTLMGRKLAAAEAVEGKFSTEGLAAMGGEDASMEIALAQSLVHQIDDMDPAREWGKITKMPTANRTMQTATLENLLRQRAAMLKLNPNTFIRQQFLFA
ncbi:MAG: DEAD/DEAH box helicase family protein [Pirellulaceae bacterium]